MEPEVAHLLLLRPQPATPHIWRGERVWEGVQGYCRVSEGVGECGRVWKGVGVLRGGIDPANGRAIDVRQETAGREQGSGGGGGQGVGAKSGTLAALASPTCQPAHSGCRVEGSGSRVEG